MNKTTAPPSAMSTLMNLARAHDVPLDQMFSMVQEPHLVRYRHEAWATLYALKTDDGRSRLYTLARIGSWWGVRHSTLSEALKPVDLKA